MVSILYNKRLRETKSLNWESRLKARYAELRQTHFTKEALAKRFNDYARLFAESGADSRERSRWDGIDRKQINIPQDVAYITNWISTRLDYLDEQYGYDVTGLHTVLAPSNTSLTAVGHNGAIIFESTISQALPIYNLAGQLVTVAHLTAGQNIVPILQAGVYIVKGKKVIVQ